MKEPILIIMAAGLGSRYGGLKQADAFLPQNKTIIEYSLYDAFQAGFRRFIIIVKQENEEIVKQTIRHSFDESYDIQYVYQTQIVDRKKPLGTAHALYCCKDIVDVSCGVINGDDYYGKNAYVELYHALKKEVNESTYVMVGYPLKNTLSKFGSVSRGLCHERYGYLQSIEECTSIHFLNDQIVYDDAQNQPHTLEENQIVSMNMWGVSQDIFKHINYLLDDFLKNEYLKNPEKAEFYLPSVIDYLIHQQHINVKVYTTNEKWYGVTYIEDRQEVIEGISQKLDQYDLDLKKWQHVVEHIEKIAYQFNIEDTIIQILPNHSGNINDTYIIKGLKNDYLLQRINHSIFKNVDLLMNNMSSVIKHLNLKNIKTLKIIPTLHNKSYIQIGEDYYRMLSFIENSFTYDFIEKVDDFYHTGYCFGEFYKALSDFDVTTIGETIPDFHHTPKRFEQFLDSLNVDYNHRRQEVSDEIEYLLSRQPIASLLYDLYQDHKIPMRVCHNDTKLSNILMDQNTHLPICVIDFDTIMPGFAAFDFGDAMRSGANHTYEDNPNLEEVYLDLDLFKAFSKGFLKACGDILNQSEKDSLVLGVKVIVYEQSLRFLSDYLNGDVYYKINYPTHNLVRAKNQIKLLQDIEAKEEELVKIIQNIK